MGKQTSGRSQALNRGGRRGQALLVAVLLMSVILLVGILFAAVVSFNQGQSGRHVDMVAAEQHSQAGINYASSMLENSPQGADWRPRFVAYAGTGTEDPGDPNTWPKDPSTWPSPPARYAGDGSVDFNFWGPDGQEGTEDDYYSDFDIVRGWFPLRQGTRLAPGPFIRFGFHRFPDPNQVEAGAGSRDSTNLGRGYFLLQVTYDPDPPFEPGDPTSQDRMSGYTRIVSIGRAVEESNVFRRVVAYKPIGLTDHLRWVTNTSGGARQATLGVRPEIDMNASSSWESGEHLLSYFPGPIRADVPLYWVGKQTPTATGTGPSAFFRLESGPATDEGYLRDDFILAPRGLFALDGADGDQGAAVEIDGGAPALLPSSLDTDAPNAPDRVYVGTADVPAMAAADLSAKDPVSGVSRYHALTRDSGRMLRATAADPDRDIAIGDPVNAGMYGRGAGVYVDNLDDIQYETGAGQSDLTQLVNDWLKTPQGQGPGGGQTGWNATFTTYTPPAVEIEFFPTEAAVAATSTGGISVGDAPPAGVGTLWWPNHQAGAPGIKITRHDRRWRRADDAGGVWHVGEDSGRNVLVVDYPAFPNQVIMAEGNIRVKGVLPASDSTVPALNRSFDVTVVSNATIYIDGQLMTAQDVLGRRYGTNDPNANGVLDEDTAKVALLARDYVCLNPTQLVPQLTTGLVTVAADDETNPTLADQHWELFPDTGGAVYTQWRMGWPDIDLDGDGRGDGIPGTRMAGHGLFVTPIHAAADPGPSGMGMTVYNEVAGTVQPFVFPGTGGAIDPYTFLFVPPGAMLGSLPSPAPYASNAILPNWQTPGSTPAYNFANPVVPFDVSALTTTNIGAMNSVSLFHRDPQIGAGSTPYLVKKWKVEELRQDAGYPYQIPQGAIHAKVNALMYAQRGSWFVIPGSYFDPNAVTQDYNGSGAIDAEDSLYAARFRRYNYEITVRGAITEDHTAPLEAVQLWTTRWAYPIYTGSGANLSLAWGTIKYEFDERLRMNRDQGPTELQPGNVRTTSAMAATPESSLPKLPCLPSSPTLIYAGGTL